MKQNSQRTYKAVILLTKSHFPTTFHDMLSSTHHIDIQCHQHVFLQPAPSDPCHLSEVPKTEKSLTC
uniref:Uncharacterized protein n=1 Tax=Arundo donax TaxID=35708 RepID=A0A0A9D601_ARUDO